MQAKTKTLLALDVGNRRIGVAIANLDAPFARPHATLEQSEAIFEKLAALTEKECVATLVVGLPRNLQGEATAQTKTVEGFVEELKKYTDVPVVWQDEALTSVKAEEELERRGKAYNKSDVDALAATYILEDYIAEHPRSSHV